MKSNQSLEIIWAIPCFNEEIAIGDVVSRIKASCPSARIIVFDNGSTDGTIAVARAAGAEIRSEVNRGKGNVVRRIFRDCNSDVVIMIDGDNTNDVEAWASLVEPISTGAADMVIGCRLDQSEDGAFRPMHHAGNLILGLLMRGFFKLPVRDVLSGYRAFSRRMYKTMPVEASGFEIETEMTLKAVEMKWSVSEVPTRYACRPAGSHSKLRTFHDGLIIGFAIFRVLKDSKPFTFFGAIALINFVFASAAWNTDANVAAAFFAFAGIMSGATGVVLNAVSQRAKELMQILAMRE